MDLFEYIILFISVFLGGGIAFYFQKNNETILQLVLSFTGAFILGIAVLHMLPVAFSQPDKWIGLMILIGFLVQLFLEQFSKGVEHGHIHAARDGKVGFAIQVMLGLCVHAFFEGMSLSNDSIHAGHHHDDLLLGIILHKAPAAFALVLLFLFSGYQRLMIWGSLFLFACMSPLGAWVAEYLEKTGIISSLYQNYIIAFVIGSFLHIATTIIFEVDNSSHHTIPIKKLIAIIVGVGLAILTIH